MLFNNMNFIIDNIKEIIINYDIIAIKMDIAEDDLEKII